MTTPSQAASELLSLFVTPGPAYGGARPYRTFPVLPAGDGLGRFPGTLQAAFLAAGYQLSDLVAGLAYAVTEGWLALVQTYTGGMQEYALLQAGFAEASGTAPTMAQSAQQLINTLVNVEGGTAFAQTYKLETLVSNFVGTVGGNNFAPEDLAPGAWYAVQQGWLMPSGDGPTENIFTLTPTGVAAAT